MTEIEVLTLIDATLKKVNALERIVDIRRFDANYILIKFASGEYTKIKVAEDPEKGDKGDKGDPGLNGRDGIDGINGIDGKDGKDGLNGRDGIDGTNGVDGKDGINGKRGAKGKDGANGVDGKDGRDGADGKDGKDGAKGDRGEPGNGIVSIKFNKRDQLIITTDDREYNLGVIKKRTGGGGGGAADFLYTNSLPMPNDVGGIPAGTTFDKVGLKDLWTRLLYSYSDPVFSQFTIENIDNPLEVGQQITAGNYNVTWNIDNPELLKSDSIKITYVNTSTVLADNLPNTGGAVVALPNIVYSNPTIISFKIEAMNTMEESFSMTQNINVWQRVYIGESANGSLVDSDAVKALRFNELRSNINGEYAMEAGGYKWFCYPAAWGARARFYDTSTHLSVPMMQPVIIDVINDYGLSEPYLTYRTYNTLGGTITIGIE